MQQDLLFHPLQFGAGVEPQLVRQSLLYSAVGGERVCLAPGPVQGGDEQLP
jgi:hypothetical protein